MGRTSKSVKKQQEELLKQQEELAKQAELLKQQEEEAKLAEEELLKSVGEQIKELCEKNGLYNGFLVTKQILLELMDMFLKNPNSEVIQIDTKLYFKEE